MIENAIREKKIYWIDPETFEEYVIEFEGNPTFISDAPINSCPDEGVLSYIPVAVYDGILGDRCVGELRLGTHTYKGVTRRPVSFYPSTDAKQRAKKVKTI